MLKRKILILPVILVFILAGCTTTNVTKPESGKTQELQNRVKVTVTRVVDGDTVEVLLNGKEEDVRLIGVDTPETKHPTKPVEPYGPEASAFTKKNLEGKKVYLEFDAQQRDNYGRLLCYLYLEDGTFYNAELIRQGYAQVLTVPPNVRHSDMFVQLQREARENNRGMWGLEPDSSQEKQEKAYIGSSNSKKFHRPDCEWGQKIADHNKVVFKSKEEALDQGYAPCKVCGP
ncbi:thermonuclease family protein [Desulfolucanica intricata]|uniref:thermonuclease family protein n=1 Tax=Desulfolucanica intricata TaxID=1285191 RepID=UPI00083064B8|nr:thermonuclease family protein [Desulfolucanica intricata]